MVSDDTLEKQDKEQREEDGLSIEIELCRSAFIVIMNHIAARSRQIIYLEFKVKVKAIPATIIYLEFHRICNIGLSLNLSRF